MTTASPDLGQIEQENRDALEVGTTATTAQKGRKPVSYTHLTLPTILLV